MKKLNGLVLQSHSEIIDSHKELLTVAKRDDGIAVEEGSFLGWVPSL